MKHLCHWPSCKTEVPPRLWGCRQHWYALPKPLRDRLWATYESGQEITKTPSLEYLRVAADVQRWIQDKAQCTPPAAIELAPTPRLALTLIQPWGHAIAHLGKWIENRGWCPPRSALGARICIHAGAKCDRDSIDMLRTHGHVVPQVPDARAIVATTVIGGWVRDPRCYSETLTRLEAARALASEWYVPGQVAWVLRDTIPLSTPIPCKGALGLWHVPDVARAALGGEQTGCTGRIV